MFSLTSSKDLVARSQTMRLKRLLRELKIIFFDIFSDTQDKAFSLGETPANGGYACPSSSSEQFIHEGHSDTSAASSDWVSYGDGAAIDVGFFFKAANFTGSASAKSFRDTSVTAAKASLISMRSIASMVFPNLVNSFSMVWAGTQAMYLGVPAAHSHATIVPRTLRPSSSAFLPTHNHDSRCASVQTGSVASRNRGAAINGIKFCHSFQAQIVPR